MPDLSLVRAAAENLVRYAFKPWFYGDSVGAEGLVRASQLLGDDYYEGLVHGFARGAFARDAAPRPMDNTVPGHVLTDLAQRRNDSGLLADLGALLDHLQRRPLVEGVPVSLERAALVQPYGGAYLPPVEVALLNDPGPAVYVDCMHFDPPFLCSYGQATGNATMVERGLRMAESFISILQGPDGLFDHFFLPRTGRSYIAGWSRGQGWAAMGLLDVLETVGLHTPEAKTVKESLVKLAARLIETQLPGGHWGALVGDSESPVETSAAAFFAACLLRMRRLGIAVDGLDQAAELAMTATMNSVDASGRLRGVSATVWSSTQPEHYRNVPVDHMVPWSQGPLLIAMWEQVKQENDLEH